MYDAALLDILPKLTQRPERKYTQTNARNRSNDSLFRKVNKKKNPLISVTFFYSAGRIGQRRHGDLLRIR